MALSFKTLCRNSLNFSNLTIPVKWVVQKNIPIKISSAISHRNQHCSKNNHRYLLERKYIGFLPTSVRQCSAQENQKPLPPEKKEGLMQRLKDMYKHYWYVAIPVHLSTSAVWFGCFYYAVRSGLDVIAILQSIGVSEKLIAPLRESSAGYLALAFALYKAATPLRYTVTVGATTYAIKKLTAIGLIKPVSTNRIKEMIQEKKDNFMECTQNYQSQMKEKKSNIMDEMKRYKTEIRTKKNKLRRSLNRTTKPQ